MKGSCESTEDGWHRPDVKGEPYVRLGVLWQRPRCKCGRILSPRRVPDTPAPKPGKGRGK